MPEGSLTCDRACPQCGTGNTPYRNQAVFTQNQAVSLGLNRCHNCGQQYVSPCLSQQALERMYGSDYSTETVSGANHLDAATCASDYAAFRRFIMKYLNKGGALLDIGCGVGNMLDVLSADGFTLKGSELSAYAAEIAQKKGHSVIAGDFMDAGFADASFDGVTLLYVLEHVFRPRDLLSEVWRVLKPGGYLFLAVPNYRYLRLTADNSCARLIRGKEKDLLHSKEHLQNFTPKTLKSLIERQGYSVVKFGCAKPLRKGSFLSRMIKSIAFGGVYLVFLLGYHCGGIQCIAQRPKDPS